MNIVFEDYNSFWYVIFITVAISYFFTRLLDSFSKKVIYVSFCIFFYIYNGIGIAYGRGIVENYLFYYIVFLFSFSLFFYLILRFVKKEFRIAHEAAYDFILKIALSSQFIIGVLVLYFITLFFPLIYPTLRLNLLLNPPKPDILTQFQARINEELPVLVRTMTTLATIIYPFYLISFYKYRLNLIKLFLLLFTPLYIYYCNISYINRGYVLSTIIIYISFIWRYTPRLRKHVTIFLLIVLPSFITFLFQYQSIRGGNETEQISATDALGFLFYTETLFPTLSEKALASNEEYDLLGYYYWIVTLPIPKVVIGKVNPQSAQTSLSETLLGVKETDTNYFAFLTGLLTESLFMYGYFWFFIHALTVAFFAALCARISEFNPVLAPFSIFYAINFAYTLNRSGMSGALPFLINQFFLFYLLFAVLYLRRKFNPKKIIH